MIHERRGGRRESDMVVVRRCEMNYHYFHEKMMVDGGS